MKEYRKIIKVHAVSINRDGLYELERIIKDDVNYEIDSGNYFDITLGIEDHEIRAKSFEELFNEELSGISNQLRVEIKGWNEGRDIDKSIHLTMHHNFIQYQISSTSESWFLGKIE